MIYVSVTDVNTDYSLFEIKVTSQISRVSDAGMGEKVRERPLSFKYEV